MTDTQPFDTVRSELYFGLLCGSIGHYRGAEQRRGGAHKRSTVALNHLKILNEGCVANTPAGFIIGLLERGNSVDTGLDCQSQREEGED